MCIYIFNKFKIIHWCFDCVDNITELSFITKYGKRLADRVKDLSVCFKPKHSDISQGNIQMFPAKMQVNSMHLPKFVPCFYRVCLERTLNEVLKSLSEWMLQVLQEPTLQLLQHFAFKAHPSDSNKDAHRTQQVSPMGLQRMKNDICSFLGGILYTCAEYGLCYAPGHGRQRLE